MERTPLHIASVHGKTQVVELLLKLKANIEAQDSVCRSFPEPNRLEFYFLGFLF